MNHGNTNTRTLKKFSVWSLLIIFTLGGITICPMLLWGGQITKEVATMELMSVAGSASVEEVTRLIQEGAYVNTVDEVRRSPLMSAAKENLNPEVLRVLIENSADINAVDKDGWTPLMLAARNNSNPDVLRVLIERGADVNAVDKDGLTPLMYAARNNSNPEVLRVLIERGADVNAADKDGWTPLMYAARNNSNPDVLRVLIEGGADVNAVDKDGLTPLILAARNNSNPDVLRVLIKGGANVNATDKDGWTPIVLAARNNSNLNVLQVLIKGGADVNAADKDGWTPLMFAARNNLNLNVLRVLIAGGADVNAADKDGETPLMLAARNKLNLNVLRVLIAGGADVNAADKDGETPLMYAARYNSNLDVLRVLIERGADVNVVTNSGSTPLMYAAGNSKNPEALRILIERGADVNAADKDGWTPLIFAARNNSNPDVLQVLIERGADVNAVTKDRLTPLILATQNNSNPEVLQVLIKGGADVNAADKDGETPLKYAASSKKPEVLRVLIEGGADVNAANKYGRTPLISAAHNNSNLEVLRVLIENGADVNVVVEDGQTPLILAVIYNSNPEVLRLLIEEGADVAIKDRYGYRALDYAEEKIELEGTNEYDLIREKTLSIPQIESEYAYLNRNIASKRLLSAASQGEASVEEVVGLIQEGADVNAVDKDGWTPLMLAVNYSLNLEVLQVLIEGGADVNATTKGGRTPLEIATTWDGSDFNIVRLLIERGADANTVQRLRGVKQRAKKEVTDELLTVASYANLWEVIQLVQEGADVNAVDEYGWTPLMLAAMDNPDSDVLRFLIDGGANVNAVDNNGWTPLMITHWQHGSHDDYENVEELLIENGADEDIKDKKGREAFGYLYDYDALYKEMQAYRHQGIAFTYNTDLTQYHPWSDDNILARLDSSASLRISGNYPRLDGGTSAYPLYAPVANEVYAADNKEELKEYLRCSRTEGAYERLIGGRTDVIFVAQPSDEQLEFAEEAGVELYCTPVAKDAFVFVVNDRNPVVGLSVEQIRDIYLRKITNWREVGGNDRIILPFQRQPNSGSQTAMEKEVMKGEKMPAPLGRKLIDGAMDGLITRIAQYRDQEESIGYSFRFFTEEMVRKVLNEKKKEFESLSLYPPESDDARKLYTDSLTPVKLLAVDGIEPSVENIRNGTYPFTISVYAVTTGRSNPRSQELINWMLSPQGQELIEKTGFVGVKND